MAPDQKYHGIEASEPLFDATNQHNLPLQDLSNEPNSDEEYSDHSDHAGLTLKRRRAPTIRQPKSQNIRRPWQKACSIACDCLCCKLSRKCALFTVLITGFLGLSIFGGGFWVYSTVPKDGLSPPWYPAPLGGTTKSWQKSYEQARYMVERMTLIEKVNITTGTGWSMDLCVGQTAAASLVGFPSLCLQDGPLGLRFADHATAFPAGLTTGATWNRDLMRKRGSAHGKEAKEKGVNVLLGPAMGPLGRNPAGGRIWEGFGSDPVLQGIAAAETIRGIQGENVIATAKHFVGNEQEHFRQSFEWGLPNAMSSNIDDRTLHEVYAWPFADSIHAGVGSIMCSYQMVNNSYACGNSKLMNGILKDELGFQGFTQSDWLAQRSGVGSSLSGLDMSMPGDGLGWMDGKSLWGPELTISVLNGTLPLSRMNDMTTRIVAAWYQVGQNFWEKHGPNFSSWTNDKIGKVHEAASNSHDKAIVNNFVDVQGGTTDEEGDEPHRIVARQVAAEGTVLVKNVDGILPLSRSGLGKESTYRVAIIGEDAGPGKGPNHCADRGCNQGTLAVGWGSGASEFPYLVDPASALRANFSENVLVTEYLSNTVNADLESTLEDQDLCIVFANSDAGEGFIAWNGIQGDRNSLDLQKGGDKLINSVAKQCGKGQGKTIVVIHAVGPVNMEEWADLPEIKAILLAHLPGQESGNALSDVIFGEVDASGRLPYTIGRSLDDYGPGAKVLYYPNGVVPQADFDEGLYIDYRHFDKYNIEPRYPFGFGLSYTTFNYSDMTVTRLRPKSPLPDPRKDEIIPAVWDEIIPEASAALFPTSIHKLNKYIYTYISDVKEATKKPTFKYPVGYDIQQSPSQAGGGEGGNPSLYETYVRINFKLTNTGARTGKEAVQLYLSCPENVFEPETNEKIDFPLRVLRNFKKIELGAGKSEYVSLHLTRRDLSYWSAVQQNWVMPTTQEFKIHVGRHSRDLPLVGYY